MDNHDLAEIWAYHDGTKHSVESVYRSGHRLEWAIMPRPFKVYPNLDPIALPRDFTSSTRSVLAALADRGTAAGDGPPLGRGALARLLYFSAGVLRRKTYAGGEIYFRAAACTGALYHIDLYLISGPFPDLEAGVYHFRPRRRRPRRRSASRRCRSPRARSTTPPSGAHTPPRRSPRRRRSPPGAGRSRRRCSRRPAAPPCRSRRASRRRSRSRR